jgi:hypothetical protein
VWRDRHLLFWIFAIDALYLVSFVLPLDVVHVTVMGWEAFVVPLESVIEKNGEAVDKFLNVFSWMPNPLLWAGVICLGSRRPHLALAAGVIATGIAVFDLKELEFLSLRPGDEWNVLLYRSGAYVWTASMLSLAIAGAIFTRKQWRQTRRLPMVGER